MNEVITTIRLLSDKSAVLYIPVALFTDECFPLKKENHEVKIKIEEKKLVVEEVV